VLKISAKISTPHFLLAFRYLKHTYPIGTYPLSPVKVLFVLRILIAIGLDFGSSVEHGWESESIVINLGE
jgi:hypothetical protein